MLFLAEVIYVCGFKKTREKGVFSFGRGLLILGEMFKQMRRGVKMGI